MTKEEEIAKEFQHTIYKGKVDLNIDYETIEEAFSIALYRFKRSEDAQK